MVKGLSKNILCDQCRAIIANTHYITISGKNKQLHYCNAQCLDNSTTNSEAHFFKPLTNGTTEKRELFYKKSLIVSNVEVERVSILNLLT